MLRNQNHPRAARPAAAHPADTRSAWLRYSVAILAAPAGLLLRFALASVLALTVPYITFFPFVMLSAWFGGFGPGLLTTGLSAALASYFLLLPADSFIPRNFTDALGLLLFLFVSVTISWLIGALHTARIRAEQNEILAEQRLQEFLSQQQRAEVTLASIADAVIATDASGRVVYMNSIAEKLTGWAGPEAAGHAIEEIFRIISEDTGQVVESPVMHALRDGKIVALAANTLLLSRQGAHIAIDDSGAPIRDSAGKIQGAVVVFRDVTGARYADQNNRLLASLVENSDAAIISKDLNGIVTSWNLAAERIFGYTASEMIGQPIATIADPNNLDEMPAILGRIKRGERVEHFETVRRAKDGALVDIALTVSPISDSSGRIIGASKIARDIGERKKSLVAIQQSEARLSLALDSGAMGVWEWDIPQGKITWSPQLEELHRIPVGSFGGTLEDFQKDMHPHDRDRVIQAIQQALETCSTYATEYRIIPPDGVIAWVEARGQIFADAHGKPLRMVGVCMNITERKLAEEELLRQADRLARSNMELQQFAYVSSHDLQEPLRNMTIFAQLLSTEYVDSLEPKANEYLSYIIQGASRMSELVRDLLSYSMLANSELAPTTDVNLNTVVEIAMTNLQLAIQANAAVIRMEDLPTIRADKGQLVQVFQNLLSNAIKYRSEDPPEITISVEKDPEGTDQTTVQGYTIAVRDNGIGIPPAYRERVFGLFKRLHRDEYPGTGIGLTICKKIVEEHGGQIWIESGARGTTFKFSLKEKVAAALVRSGE